MSEEGWRGVDVSGEAVAPHLVQQGDHPTKLAFRFGVDPRRIAVTSGQARLYRA
jgi:hypothetical protein